MPRALRGYEEFTSCKVAGLPSTTLIQNELSGIFQDFFSEIFSVSIWQNIIEADFAFIIKINMKKKKPVRFIKLFAFSD